MHRGDVQFAWSEDVAIAYQVVGDGPIDLVYLPPFVSNLDWQWEYPPHARYLERLASFSRLIVVDRRGWGCSDRVTPGSFPPFEVAADDLIAVLDAVGSSQAALFAGVEAGFIAPIAAATHPDRFSALILYQAAATYALTEETPWSYSPEEWQASEAYWREMGTVTWMEDHIRRNEPSLAGDRAAAEYLTKLGRGTIGPGGGLAELHRYASADIRAVLPTIQAPTLVLYRPAVKNGDVKDGRFLASKIPGARLVELPGADYLPWAGESEALLGEVEEFLTGVRHVPESDRVLATVLFTDIVVPPRRRRSSATRRGKSCSPGTTNGRRSRSRSSAAPTSTRPAMDYSPRSMALPVPCDAPRRSDQPRVISASRSGRAVTRARSS